MPAQTPPYSPRVPTMLHRIFVLFAFAIIAPLPSSLPAIEPTADAAMEESALDEGHSFHGEAFNEGPRQAAVLVPGLAKIQFPTSTKSDQAQQFFEQGVAFLHAFAYLEAERSFRQSLKHDPELAIAYWGMAMANASNPKRARGMIDKAKPLVSQHADQREKLYVDALDHYLPTFGENAPKDDAEAKSKRAARFISDMEKILYDFPDDIEAKAFLVLRIWLGDREGVKLTSRFAVDALMSEIFAIDPMHPAHHYRIHLWDPAHAELGLDSAAKCGPSMPGVAHMWHMPGHIYSKLNRYADAAWQQEASARVDHAHMMRARLMPDQIHNFAHNNEWLIRNLLFVGRVNDAIEQGQNLVSLPQHPKYNSMDKKGSYKHGRERLLQTYSEYGLWGRLINESNGNLLPPIANMDAHEELLAWVAVAHFQTGNAPEGARTLRSLQRRRLALEGTLLDLADEAAKETDSSAKDADDATPEDAADAKQKKTPDELRKHLEKLRRLIARAAAAAAAHRKDAKSVKEFAKKANLDNLIQAQFLADAGDLKSALEIAQQEVKKRQGQVRPQAILVDLLWRNGDHEEAKKQFETLRALACDADLDTPLLQRVSLVATALNMEEDWRIKREPANDLGERPALDSLGPFRWQPYDAPAWEAMSADGTPWSAGQFSGRPRLVVFYLGFGCLHCMEQLHAFAPKLEAFREAGIEVVAISTENVETLASGIAAFDEQISIPLFADGDQTAFKSFRCWDDFEGQPLHGTFLIDAQDRVRWQDIGFEPFMDPDFLLEESKRLLKLQDN